MNLRMKKLINDPDDIIDEMLDGMTAAYPSMRRLPDTQVLVRDDAPVDGKVGVVSGGGSGHEPTHGGYIGDGMLGRRRRVRRANRRRVRGPAQRNRPR